jgi:hypothetical protein
MGDGRNPIDCWRIYDRLHATKLLLLMTTAV